MEFTKTQGLSDFCCKGVGYAHVVPQNLTTVFNPKRALAEGTVFPELAITIADYERGLYDGK
jgi:hypothetical protein